MAVISTIFSRKWDIRFPVVTRYLEPQYVDEFFNEGKLRLSSFQTFRNNPDEQQGDPYEGRVSMNINTPNGNHAISAINGQEAYILCAGTVESKQMESNFKSNDGFRILNTLAFADAISRHIPGFITGMEGLCSYRASLLIEEHDETQIRTPETYSNPDEWSKEYERYIGEKSMKIYFIKNNIFSHQGEYRFIWFTTGEFEKEYIDIICPEARRFCQRLPKNSF